MPQLYNELGYGEGGYPGFPFELDHFYPLQVLFATSIIEHEDGTEQRVTDMHTPVLTWEGILYAQDDDRKEAIEGFFDGQKSNVSLFSIQDPLTNTIHRVRFEEDTLTFAKRTDSRWDVAMRFREVL